MSSLCYRAGPAALARLRAAGLRGQIRVFVAPATGPKWLVAYGFDRALIEARLLDGARPTLLAGASAGAWRALSLASGQPDKTHPLLARAYTEQVFSREDTPRSVGAAYARMLSELFDGRQEQILGHPTHRLAIHTARARGSGRWQHERWHLVALAAAALLNPWTSRAQHAALERVTFHSPQSEPWLHGIAGRRVPLSADNLLSAALASASVPFSMEPIRAIHGAPLGCYLDGGMTDYHISEPYAHEDGITLLFTHQARIEGRWLDQYLPWRRPQARVLDSLVHVYPSADFVAALPGGVVPSRHDFVRFADASKERIRRWKEALARSESLGEEFLSDVESGRFEQRVLPFGDGSATR